MKKRIGSGAHANLNKGNDNANRKHLAHTRLIPFKVVFPPSQKLVGERGSSWCLLLITPASASGYRFPLRKIAAADVEPVDGSAPGGPEGGGEGGAAVGEGSEPLAGPFGAAGDVGLAVAVEVADLDVDPGD